MLLLVWTQMRMKVMPGTIPPKRRINQEADEKEKGDDASRGEAIDDDDGMMMVMVR